MGDIIQLHHYSHWITWELCCWLQAAAAAALLAGYEVFDAFGQTSTINTWSFK